MSSRRFLRITVLRVILLVLLIAVIALIGYEMHASRLQARLFTGLAAEVKYAPGEGTSPSIQFPKGGPYDERAGYTRLPDFMSRLQDRGYTITRQSRWSPRAVDLVNRGIFPIYREKNQIGLRIVDQNGQEIYHTAYPQRVYGRFADIPPIIVESLLFIENRELFEHSAPQRNPAIEWDRLAKAGLDYLINKVFDDWKVTGGSTLATQFEKFRHSPEGITSSPEDKVKQMVSASLRAYQYGPETWTTRQQIVLDYINSIPLAALPGFGEVNGLGDGLWYWFGADFDQTNERLAQPQIEAMVTDAELWARAYRQTLSLFIAHRAPSVYLLARPDELEKQTDQYIRLMTQEGLIREELRDVLLRTRDIPQKMAPEPDRYLFTERKAINAVRTHLIGLLGVSRLYELDRMDMTAVTSLNPEMQSRVIAALARLDDPQYAESAGLLGHRLLGSQDVEKVIYSFTLYERSAEANWLRIQADNLDQPLDINEGAKLELGSTAKLRTLASYLEIISFLHREYAGNTPTELQTALNGARDNLTRWALGYLRTASDTELAVMLNAAMERWYSTSPAERFFTGGGVHRFSNFDNKNFGGAMSVRAAFYNSVNLVFIRMMRDIVQYYTYRVPGSTALLVEGGADSLRQVYLEKFADREGITFIRRFYNKYEDKSPQEAIEILLSGRQITPTRLAVIFRTIHPDAGEDALAEFIHDNLPNATISDRAIQELYDRYAASKFSLSDRGYIARIHPLELWTLSYLKQIPGASFSQVIQASKAERISVYDWLFKTRYKNAQDIRIRTMLEVEAFLEIHRSWKRMGYPFETLVPSYATSIGSSADRPAALAELVGIILNRGVRKPVLRVNELYFGVNTPYETVFKATPPRGEQVLAPEVADALRSAMAGVVEEGTAQRIKNTFMTPDGQKIPIGGKTGTGDNRFTVYRRQDRMTESRVINRTATFVFFIGDRFYGTITAYVPGKDAASARFTSSLPVQLLKHLSADLDGLYTPKTDSSADAPQADARD